MNQAFLIISGLALMVGGCARSDPYYTARDPYVQGNRTHSRNAGMAGGSVAGAIIGNNSGIGTVGGAAVGAVLGGILGDVSGRNSSQSHSGMSTSSGSMSFGGY